MNLFQILALVALGLLILLELRRCVVRKRLVGIAILRMMVWLLACLAILFPDALTHVARSMGIGRGADILLYGLVLAFVGISFALYSRILRLERRQTELVRELAILKPLSPTSNGIM